MSGLALRARMCSGVTVTAMAAIAAIAASMAAPAAWAGKAHEHGVARLDIGVEAGRITLSFELPLEDLAGFERAPRADAERATVAAALVRLREVGKLVRIDGAAGCGPGSVELTAPVWGVGGAPAAAGASSAIASGEAASGSSAHNDLEARYQFMCPATDRARHVDLGLFEAFARLKRIEVQVVMPRGQMKIVLRRPQSRVGLAR